MCGWDPGFSVEAFQGPLSMKVKGKGRLNSEKHRGCRPVPSAFYSDSFY